MALGADDVQAAVGGDARAELDVGAASGHVRGDRDRAGLPGARDDRRLALVLLRVQHLVLHAAALQQIREVLGVLDRDRADEDRALLAVALQHVLDHRLELLALRAVDEVRHVLADHRQVRRHDDYLEAVDLVQLLGVGHGGAGHAGELLVEAEEVLERDRRVGHGFLLDLHALLGLDGLVQPVRPAASLHQAARELVDDHDVAVAHHVLAIALVDDVRLERRLHVARQPEVLRGEDVVDAQPTLEGLDARFGEVHRARALLDGVVRVALQARHQRVEARVKREVILLRAGDDQRRPRLVDQHRVGLVDDRVVAAALHALVGHLHHVVAQVVEAELVVRAVGHVRLVGLAARNSQQLLSARLLRDALARVDGGALVLDHAQGQAQRVERRPVPLRLASRQVVVDRDQVRALALEGVHVERERGDKRLALARAHLGDVAAVQRDGAGELHVVGALADMTVDGLASDGERLREHVVQHLAVAQARAEAIGAFTQRLVAERADLRLEVVDLPDQRARSA